MKRAGYLYTKIGMFTVGMCSSIILECLILND